MITGILGFLLLGALVIGALCERRRSHKPSAGAWWQSDQQANEYLSGGEWRDYYAPFDGRDLDRHERNHYQAAMIHRACELAEARRSGRLLGRSVTVSWRPGQDPETDQAARWLLAHGGSCGVYIKKVRG